MLRFSDQLTEARQRLQFRINSSKHNPFRIPLLQGDGFAGKRVIVVGPASTVKQDVLGVDVDSYDVVVRLNKGIELAISDAEGHLGTRTDVLFHNLVESGQRNAGKIPPELLRHHGVKTVVFPHWTPIGSKRRVHAKHRQLYSLPDLQLVVLHADFCSQLRRLLGGVPPTVGTSAVLYFLTCELEELAIHGFTYFETPYLSGYNDLVRTAADAQKWIAQSPVHHDPGAEKLLTLKWIAEARRRGMKVSLGSGVEHHLST